MPPETKSDSLPEDKTEIDEQVKLEVEILALAALRCIGIDIADRLKLDRRVRSDARIILDSKEGLAAIPHYRAVVAGFDALIAEGEAILKPGPEEAAPETVAVLTAAQASLQGLADVLAFFRAETVFLGRSVTVDAAALQSALAGALAARGFDVVLPEFISALANKGRDGLLERLARLRSVRAGLEAIVSSAGLAPKDVGATDQMKEPVGDEHERSVEHNPNARAATVIAEIDSFLKTLCESEADVPSPLMRAIAGAEAISLLADQRQTLWLTAKALTAGGSYKTQRHLFTTLFTGSRLTYSGGAAASFVVVDGKTSSVIIADVLHEAVGHGRFRGHGSFWRPNKHLLASNLLQGTNEPVPHVTAAGRPAPAVADKRAAGELQPSTTPSPGDDQARPGGRQLGQRLRQSRDANSDAA